MPPQSKSPTPSGGTATSTPKPKATGGGRTKAATSAVTTASAVGGPGGAALGGASYIRERREQKKAKRETHRQAEAEGKAARQVSDARSRGAGKARPFLTRDMPRQVLLAEFIVCMVIVGMGTLVAPSGSNDGTTRMMVKMTGLSALFFILAMVSAGGAGAAKTAGSLGLLVSLSYLFTSSDATNILKWISAYYSRGGTGGGGLTAGGEGDNATGGTSSQPLPV